MTLLALEDLLRFLTVSCIALVHERLRGDVAARRVVPVAGQTQGKGATSEQSQVITLAYPSPPSNEK